MTAKELQIQPVDGKGVSKICLPHCFKLTAALQIFHRINRVSGTLARFEAEFAGPFD